MQCKINPKYFCYRQFKTGKGIWDYAKDICVNCEIFNREKQTILEVIILGKQAGIKWIEAKKKQLEAARTANRKAKGMEDLYNMPIGETEITIDVNIEPRIAKTKYGDRDVLRIHVGKEGEAKDWMISPNSPFYMTILENISEGKAHMIIVRSGTELSTRYSIKSAW